MFEKICNLIFIISLIIITISIIFLTIEKYVLFAQISLIVSLITSFIFGTIIPELKEWHKTIHYLKIL